MKSLILTALFLVSTSAFSYETLKGKFHLNGVDYELNYIYDIIPNQTVSDQRVRILDDVRLPEQTEPMPAFCMFDMTFPVNVTVKIKDISNNNVVYSRLSTEYLTVSAYGGLLEVNFCKWDVPNWKEKMTGLLRVTETHFSLNGKDYRYFMDTNVMVDARGTTDDLVVARDTFPVKGNDGKKDGEVWIDTKPAADGSYDRIWFPLSL